MKKTDGSPPLVSVLVPAFNHERYVGECVRSVLAQDWPRIELIVVDDGSRDGTWGVLQGLRAECGERLERVVFETQSNTGTCVTGNRLYGLMRGDFNLTMASDDALAGPGALRALVTPMLRHPKVVAVVGQNEFMDGDGKRCWWNWDGTVTYDEARAGYRTLNEAVCDWLRVKQFSRAFTDYGRLVKGNFVANGCLFRNSVLAEVPHFTTEAPLEDYWIHLQMMKRGRYLAIPDHTFRYRWHGGNASHQRERMVAMTEKTLDHEERTLVEAGDALHLLVFREIRYGIRHPLLRFWYNMLNLFQ